jgi:hypothetical protein
MEGLTHTCYSAWSGASLDMIHWYWKYKLEAPAYTRSVYMPGVSEQSVLRRRPWTSVLDQYGTIAVLYTNKANF